MHIPQTVAISITSHVRNAEVASLWWWLMLRLCDNILLQPDPKPHNIHIHQHESVFYTSNIQKIWMWRWRRLRGRQPQRQTIPATICWWRWRWWWKWCTTNSNNYRVLCWCQSVGIRSLPNNVHIIVVYACLLLRSSSQHSIKELDERKTKKNHMSGMSFRSTRWCQRLCRHQLARVCTQWTVFVIRSITLYRDCYLLANRLCNFSLSFPLIFARFRSEIHCTTSLATPRHADTHLGISK